VDVLLAVVTCLQSPADASVPIEAGDDLAARVQKLESESERLRADAERRSDASKPPAAAPPPSSPPIPPMPRYDDGIVWEDRAAPFALRMKALIQLRYLLGKTEGLPVTDSGAYLRAARLGWDGYALSPKLGYKFELEFGAGLVAPLDVYFEGRLSPHWTVRAGQMRVPFSRSWLTPEQMLLFPNRSLATEQFRYGYDIGALIQSTWLGGRLSAFFAVFNGAGPNVAANDNVDPLLVLRVEGAVTRERIARAEGDRGRTPRPAVAVGASATADYVPAPGAYGYTSGVPVSPRPLAPVDTNADGRPDGVRVLEGELDVSFRWRGLAADVELYTRREAWNDIGAAQPAVQNRFVPRTDYAGLFGQLSYSFAGGLQLGGRFSMTQLSPLTVGGRPRPVTTCTGPGGIAFECRLPYADRRAELSALAAYSLWDGHALGAVMYSLLNWSTTTGEAVPASREHNVIAQIQFAL
jgi:hypothetical protein